MAAVTVSSYKFQRTTDLDSRLSLKKRCCSGRNLAKNQIDSLPDEVLIIIISDLKLKEVARTSVLSQRWRNLWRYTTGILDFVESFPICDARHSKKSILDSSGSRLMDWVNLVLTLHKGSTLNEFKVCYGISNESTDMINTWIKFALERRVKRISLDFKQSRSSTPDAKFDVSTQVFSNCPLGFLTSVHLKNIRMKTSVIRIILSSFPSLQVLHLNSILGLARLKIKGPLSTLRCLKIKDCLSLRRLEVRAVNLVTFAYRGPKIQKFFKKVPCIVEASINKVFIIINDKKLKVERFFSRMEFLKLDLRGWLPNVKSVHGVFPKLPKLKNLKCLKLSCSGKTVESYIYLCTHLLDVSPLLHRIVLKVYSISENEDNDVMALVETRISYRHPQLKVMEIRGFRGHTEYVKLAQELCATLSGLETLVVDPFSISPPDQCGKWDVDKAVASARGLQDLLPIGIKLVIASHQSKNFGR